MTSPVTAQTRLGAVLGWPVEHSLSPALQGAAFAAAGIDAVFVALAVRPDDLGDAVRGLRAVSALGASVTVPHKTDVLAHCDRVDPLAARIGAVNCLAFEDGQVIGHNTDAGGFCDAVRETLRLELAGLRPVVLGAGGAARAVAAGLEDAGARGVVVAARSPHKAPWAARAVPWTEDALAGALAGCDLLVDATSVALSAERERSAPPVPLEALPAGAAVASLVYHRDPALLASARARGHPVLGGAGMLVHQGARAFRIWTGRDAPVAPMWAALRTHL